MALNGTGRRIVCFGEILLRLSTEPGDRGLAFADRLDLHVGGAEANVAAALSSLGHATSMVTALPEGPIGDRAIVHLRALGVDTAPIVRGAGRLGLYFVEAGAALRPSRVVYDRTDSVFARDDWSSFDWPGVLDGAALLHVSGIALAVSDRSRAATIAVMRAARQAGVRVSFDGNYRALLWRGREDQSGPAVAEALALADIAFVDRRDAALTLGRPVTDEEAPDALFAAFPDLGVVAHTRRKVDSVEVHRLSARVATRMGGHAATTERTIAGVVDRIGGGDAFAAGVLHAWCQGGDAGQMAATGLAAAYLKHSQRGDALIATPEQLADFMLGELDVRR